MKSKIIHGLTRKIDILVDLAFEKRFISKNSISEFCQYCGINYETLKSAKKAGAVSMSLEGKLSNAMEFDIDDHTWCDDNIADSRRAEAAGHTYEGSDTVDQFRRMIRTKHGLQSDYFVMLKTEPPELCDRDLLSVEFTDLKQSTHCQEAINLFFSLVSDVRYHESGLFYGFSRVRIQFSNKFPRQSLITNRLGSETIVELNGATISVQGGDHNPRWWINAESGVLEGEYATRDAPLCTLSDWQFDDIFEAEVSVRPIDGSLKSSDGNELPTREKTAIIEALFRQQMAQKMAGSEWLALGTQKFNIVRADQL